MLRIFATLLAASLLALGQAAIAANGTKDFSQKGKSADARKKGQSDERRGATPATPAVPADPGKSKATPAVPATPPSKSR